ncbi:sensor histidine kinase [Lachnoclostridium phytofermentans]|uniref:histidine kinase n=1 Tax=Lachnoclostridium phytofermentans (strain ATCC 700394 / DSM 18823 / ISDg) TaxID=357809 RepID=A9KHT4_LACP7|nr:ATP-binding protein [Lachnoclostridium phytofermentans]ABX43781.1 integral membrane sensor signal transduction histidine kinase [Lachnoclostridium phytofermentans ISDg]
MNEKKLELISNEVEETPENVQDKIKKKSRLYNRLFFKVYLNYALMVLLFAIVLGSVFLQLSEKATKNNLRQQLFSQAKVIAKRYNEFVINEEKNSLDYLELLREVGVIAEDIWVLSNPNASAPMNSEITTMPLQAVSREYQEVYLGAFAGEDTYRSSYSKTYGFDTISVGVPVRGVNGEVCGAILLNTKVERQTESIRDTKSMIFLSAIVSLIVSFIVAILFARQLVRPISKMRQTALLLAEKKYESKTGIDRKDEIGDLARTIDFLTDKLMENEVVRKNLDQMRMDFFANVSHELRTPITVVRAYTESLVDGVIEEESTKQQCYEKMLLECKSMERLVGDLLILAKMQNPDFVIEKEPVNLTQVFEDILKTVRTMGTDKHISVCLDNDHNVQLMYGDYDRLRQMFLVICDNAIKFSKEDSTIYISITRGEKLRISIRDEGTGIEKEELSSIFDKFYKSKLRQNAKGSGLGLAIARQIALKHGGTIEVFSTISVGTEFVFSFDYITEEELEQR